jgi:hypothetical protein
LIRVFKRVRKKTGQEFLDTEILWKIGRWKTGTMKSVSLAQFGLAMRVREINSYNILDGETPIWQVIWMSMDVQY